MSLHPDNKEIRDLLTAIHEQYGYDFTDYAQKTVERRIEHFMNSRKIDKLDKLTKIVLTDESFFEEFVQELSVTVTEMFRDPSFYKSIREKVVRRLATYPFIKIWIAGCATGEEVYSMAILLKEEKLLDRSLIYATDINQKSLQVAREGLYRVDNMKLYTENYNSAGGKDAFSAYYKAKYNSVMFDPSLKNNVVFAAHNLVVDRSFNEFQLIICRNVLIYFNRQLQNKVVGLFYESLCDLGLLALGNKESLLFMDKRDCFEDVDKKEKIYIKKKQQERRKIKEL